MKKKEGSGSELAMAAIVNVVAYRTLFAALSLPGWWGGMLAAGSMAIATDETASDQARKIAGGLSAPGAIAVQVLRSNMPAKNNQIKNAPCCASCALNQECESSCR